MENKKKKGSKLKVIIFLVIIILLVYVLITKYKTEEKILDVTTNLMSSISLEEYDDIRKYIKNTDGRDLNNDEIDNFLINTGLYRTLLFQTEKKEYVYKANADLFNPKEGSVSFSFFALDGSEILIELDYVNDGTNEYLTTDKISTPTKVKSSYQVAKNLANGRTLSFTNETEGIQISAYSLSQDASKNIYLNVFEEAKEDVKIAMSSILTEEEKALRSANPGYSVEWNENCSIVSIYYEQNIDVNALKANIQLSSIVMQVMNGNPEWNLTINYYNYNTKQLIKTEKIR